jgi:hypothetical protein
MATAKKKEITPTIEQEIQRLVSVHGYDIQVLSTFADFVLNPPKPEKVKKERKVSAKAAEPKGLTLPKLKAAIFDHFDVATLAELRKLGSFQMVTSGLDKLEASKKESWEIVYRKAIGIIPGEENETGDGCVNGINIFKYDMPWKAFGLDPKVNSTDDVKAAYRKLSQIYHPDKSTGNADVFDRLTIFYKSLTEKF